MNAKWQVSSGRAPHLASDSGQSLDAMLHCIDLTGIRSDELRSDLGHHARLCRIECVREAGRQGGMDRICGFSSCTCIGAVNSLR